MQLDPIRVPVVGTCSSCGSAQAELTVDLDVTLAREDERPVLSEPGDLAVALPSNPET